jgi:hypothetical protein
VNTTKNTTQRTTGTGTDTIQIPDLIAQKPEKVAAYQAGWRYGMGQLSRKEVLAWKNKFCPESRFFRPDDEVSRKASHPEENTFWWGYYSACAPTKRNCSNGESCLRMRMEDKKPVVDVLEELKRLEIDPSQLPSWAFYGHERNDDFRRVASQCPVSAVALQVTDANRLDYEELLETPVDLVGKCFA